MNTTLKKYAVGFLLAALGLSGCSSADLGMFGGDDTINEAVVSDKPIVLGVNIYRADDLFIKNMANAYTKEAQSYNNVSAKVVSAQNQQAIQNQQVKDMLAKGNQGLLINMVDIAKKTESGSALVSQAKQADVPIVFFNRDPGSKVLESYDKAYYVGSIPAQSGLLQGELIIEDWIANPALDKNKDGVLQYVVLKGEIGHADAEGRTKWVQATIQNYPDKGIVAQGLSVIGANWRRDEAKNKLADWLDNDVNASDVEVIIANNDGMALGAIDLLQERGMTLPVYGVDAVPEALKLIQSGKMAGTILQDVNGQVKESLKLSINVANDKPPTRGLDFKIIDKRVMVPYVPINKNNVDEFLN